MNVTKLTVKHVLMSMEKESKNAVLHVILTNVIIIGDVAQLAALTVVYIKWITVMGVKPWLLHY